MAGEYATPFIFQESLFAQSGTSKMNLFLAFQTVSWELDTFYAFNAIYSEKKTKKRMKKACKISIDIN